MLTSATLDSYQAGARAVRAKSLGSLALGAAALAGVTTEASAAIQVFTLSGQNVSTTGSVDTVYFSAETGVSSFSAVSITGGSANFRTTAIPIYDELNNIVGNYVNAKLADGASNRVTISFGSNSPVPYLTAPRNFVFGEAINGAPTFASSVYFNNGYDMAAAWNGVTGYVGTKIDFGPGNIHYGWLKMTVAANATSITLNQIAYNDVAGEGITAGQTSNIPEPATSAALLGLGAAGLAAYRRRKHIARAAA